MQSQDLDRLFSALAHPARRRVLDLLMEAPGMGVKALASHFEMSRIGVMKHLKVLEECGLVLSRKKGRSRHLFFNGVPIQLIHDRWSTQYSACWTGRMADIKTRVETRERAGGGAAG